MNTGDSALRQAFSSHPRTFESFRYAYPVLSRRSGGISVGVNLNPDKLCNFDCPYCQVDRRGPTLSGKVVPSAVLAEVRELLARCAATGLSETFTGVPADRRILADVALSGDGEPTLRLEFPEVCQGLARMRSEWIGSGGVPYRLVLITNATLLDRPWVVAGLEALCADGGGEIWGKLDAGTDAFYAKVSVSRTPLSKIVENLGRAAARFPLRIQSLFFAYGDLVPDDREIEAYLDRLTEIGARGPVAGVQLHTVARATAKSGCHPMPLSWLRDLAAKVESRGFPAQCHEGQESGSFTSEVSP